MELSEESNRWYSHGKRRSIPSTSSMLDAAKKECKIILSLLENKDEYHNNRASAERLIYILSDIDVKLDSTPGSPIMRSEEYRQIVDSTALVSKTDVTGTITYINKEFSRVSGYSSNELVGNSHSIVRHPDTPNSLFKDLWNTISVEKKMWTGVIKNLTKDGKEYYVDARISPQIDEMGNLVGYIGIRYDVTEKAIQKEIIEQEQKLNSMILDEQTNIVAVISKDEGVITANKAFFEIFPFSSLAEFKGKHKCICELLKEVDGTPYDMTDEAWFDVVAKEDGHISHKVTMVDKQGENRVFSTTIKPVDSGCNHHSKRYYVVTFSDITDSQKETELAKKEAFEAHQESYSKSSFLANMSHEIRTPLNGIIPVIELIEEGKLDDEQREQVSIIKRSSKSLLQIINDILDFSKIESGSFTIDEMDFDPVYELESIVDLFIAKSSEKNITMCVFIDPRLPTCVLGDPLRIKQVVANLVGNAIKFTQHGEVDFRAEFRGCVDDIAKLHISVKDSGIGIPEDRISEIFNPFTQADNTITRKFGGTGLGLAISKNLVEMMGGELKIQSTYGEGSVFSFDVLLKSAACDIPRVPHSEKKIGIYIADCSLERCETILFEYLTAFGFDYIKVHSPKEAIACDVVMVLTSGTDDLEWIKEVYTQGKRIISVIPQNLKNRNRFPSHATIFMPINGSKIYDTIIESDSRKNTLIEAIEAHAYNKYNARVLVAEDNPTNQQIAMAILRKMGIEPVIANDGKEALGFVQDEFWAKDSHFDLILMDIHMPVLNGVEATRQIRKFEKELNIAHTPIIALTADAIKGRDQEYLSVGMNSFISKPIDKKSFVDAIEHFLVHLKIVEIDDHKEVSLDQEHLPQQCKIEPKDNKVSIVMKELDLDEETAEFLLNDFYENWKRYKAELEEAVRLNNHESIRSLSHAIKGASGSLRLDDVYDICKLLEETAREGLDWNYENSLNDLIRAIGH